ncbi:MAG TPA: universal stress protein [Vicinamibacterales bacterium]|nr:universal stress protein [Vicinamibacterales bacterium]
MRIVLAIDDSPCSDAAVHAVLDRVKPEETEVLVLHAVEWPKHLSPAMQFAEGPAAADDVLGIHEEARRRGRLLVERACAALLQSHFSACSEVRDEGDARAVILDRAAEWRADLIVVGSHGRRGLDRWLLGSVSDAVVRHARCSVAVVRPTV